jgi:hypothetical protein
MREIEKSKTRKRMQSMYLMRMRIEVGRETKRRLLYTEDSELRFGLDRSNSSEQLLDIK